MPLPSGRHLSDTDDSELEVIAADDPYNELNASPKVPLVDGSERQDQLPTGRRKWILCSTGTVLFLFVVGAGLTSAFFLGLFKPSRGPLPNFPRWRMSNSNLTIGIETTAPFSVHQVLWKEGHIGDPYSGFNDVKLRWIPRETWTFESLLNVTLEEYEVGELTAVNLVCEGIDAIATIKLNNHIVAEVSNQFLRYSIDISEQIKEGENKMAIEMKSTIGYSDEMDKQIREKYGYSFPPSCPPLEQHGECHANMVRKSKAAFGSRFGPAYVTQGIWKPITINVYSYCQLTDVVAQPMRGAGVKVRSSELWSLNVTSYVECVKNIRTPLVNMTFTIPSIAINYKYGIKLLPGENTINYVMNELDVASWWPRGYGNQSLYTLNITLESEGSSSQRAVRVGFRTVSLVEPKLDNGMGFHFEINEKPVFLKGSVWVPADSFQHRVTEDRLKDLLHSAMDANMNVLRVWGGGIYEQNLFYDLADEYGLMIWQEFMFASAMYPATEEFLASCRDEIRYQVKRLASHPSIIVWVGNNEGEYDLADNRFNVSSEKLTQFRKDYAALFNGVLQTEVRKQTQGPFLMSTPSNGRFLNGRLLPNSTYYGDVHFYNYEDDCLDLSIYPEARFVSEYGWQSWPSFSTLASASSTTGIQYKSDFHTHRQHDPRAGNGTDQLMKRLFAWNATSETEDTFKHYIYLTQVVQAICLQAETEHYRRSRGHFTTQTMGAIYSQLNDIWQGPSSSTLEYGGKWKMAHHFAKNFLAPFMLSTYVQNHTVHCFAANDGDDDMIGYKLDVNVYRWDKREIWTSREGADLNLHAHNVTRVCEIDLKERLNVNESEVFFNIQLWKDWDHPIHEAFQPLVVFRDIKVLHNPKITVASVGASEDNTGIRVTLSIQNVALFVWLDAGSIRGRFSENGFHFFKITEISHTVTFYPWDVSSSTATEFKRHLTVTSLWNTLN